MMLRLTSQEVKICISFHIRNEGALLECKLFVTGINYSYVSTYESVLISNVVSIPSNYPILINTALCTRRLEILKEGT
jgi:hypothetical protein